MFDELLRRRSSTHLHLGDPGLGAPGFATQSPGAQQWQAGNGPQSLREMTQPDSGVQLFRTLLEKPAPWLPYGPGIGHQIRDYVVHLDTTQNDVTVGQSTLRPIRVDLPVAFYAITAAARKLDGTAIPDSVETSLDMFKIQLTYVQTDNIQTIAGLGSAICGTGRWPRLFGGPSLVFDKRANVNVNLIPLYDDMEVDLVLFAVEVRESTVGRQQ